MLGIIVGIAAFLLGLKGFTPSGLPLTREKNLTGTTAKVIGVVCCLLGVVLVLEGTFGVLFLAFASQR